MADWSDMEDDLLGNWDAMADAFLEQAGASHDSDEDTAEEQPGAVPEQLRPALLKPEVSVATMHAITNPYDLPSPRPSLAAVCANAVQWAKESDSLTATDGFIKKLSAFFVQAKAALHASKEAVGKMSQGSPAKIEDGLSVLAGSFIHLDRHY